MFVAFTAYNSQPHCATLKKIQLKKWSCNSNAIVHVIMMHWGYTAPPTPQRHTHRKEGGVLPMFVLASLLVYGTQDRSEQVAVFTVLEGASLLYESTRHLLCIFWPSEMKSFKYTSQFACTGGFGWCEADCAKHFLDAFGLLIYLINEGVMCRHCGTIYRHLYFNHLFYFYNFK